ncbi:hypothetical protein BDZ88DRAFT_454454 [Geranomyces variabilis]|nr:hypothetical protein BDZ88DRAFT_454454 [Geranomyces variabilis]KAJ3143636.1 hypothetical protein HDU90_000399 [Geranomyces variabilis]
MPAARQNTFQIGDCLGKGAFGSVYAALNMATGEVVAVKQIRIAHSSRTNTSTILSPADTALIMAEIDLLKELHHPNIVKYLGFSKAPSSLNIIMEYCENGSLSNISRKFGKFTERLVSLYTAQVLDGLVYLHEQGVIHRDIKGPNLLTTKDGLVKLADFGIASKVNASSTAVAGSPYWMAPEVIELSGATTASDVWSLGCTVIELLEGHPPYHNLAPMSALFRIVHDEYPPIPDRCSPVLRHFLMECFQKDPNLRISARRLLLHPFIVAAREESKANSSSVALARSRDHKSASTAIAAAAEPPKRSLQPRKSAPALRNAKAPSSTMTPPATVKTIAALPLAAVTAERDSDNEIWDDDFEDAFTDPAVVKQRIDQWTRPPQPSSHPLQQRGTETMQKSTGTTLMIRTAINTSFVDDPASETDYAGAFDIPDERAVLLPSDIVHPRNFDDELPSEQVDDDEQDPFSEMIDGFDALEVDNAAHHGSVVEEFVARLKQSDSQHRDSLSAACDAVAAVVVSHPPASKLLMTHHGIVPIIRLLTTLDDDNALVRKLLTLLNTCIRAAPEIREAVCLLGGLAAVLRFAGERFPPQVRQEVARFVRDMCCCSEDRGMPKMFLFCGGLPTLLYMLASDYWENRQVVWDAVEALASIFAVQTSASRTDLCLLFVHHGLLPDLARVLRAANSDREENAAASECVTRVVGVFLAISLADSSVREMLAKGSCLRVLIAELWNLDPERLVVVLKCVKNISMCGDALTALERAGAIPLVCRLLTRHGMPHFTDVQNQCLTILYNLCRLNRARQRAAASHGCIPLLQQFVASGSPLRQFALPILCDLVNGIVVSSAGAADREREDGVWRLLRRWNVIDSYVGLLKDPAWMVLAVEAIASWVAAATASSDAGHQLPLPRAAHSTALAAAFASASPPGSLAKLLLPLQRVLVLSAATRREFAHSAAVHDKITRALLSSAAAAGVRLNLLLMLHVIGSRVSSAGSSGETEGGDRLRQSRRRLRDVVGKLCQEDPAVLVREQARRCVDAFAADG